MTVTNISDARPHISIFDGQNVHIFQKATFYDVVNGKICFTEIDDWNIILPVILKEWMDNVII